MFQAQSHEIHPVYSSVHALGASRYQEYRHIDRSFTQRPAEPASRNAINSKAATLVRQNTQELRYKRKIFDHEEPKSPKDQAEKPAKGATSGARPLLRSPTAQSIQTITNPPTENPVTEKVQFPELNALYTSHIPYNDISCILEANTLEGGLFLGNMKAATDINLLQKYNIRAVLNITTYDNSALYTNTAISAYKFVEALDGENVDLNKDFESCTKFIESARKNKINVLVHCYAGISRSTTMVVSYLMASQKLSVHEALKYTRKRRPIVKPNNGFMYQLEEYGRRLQEEQKQLTTSLKNTARFAWF